MPGTIDKGLRPLVRQLRDAGWSITPTKGGHLCFAGPEGQRVIAPSTPSCWRTVANVTAELRRHGAPIPSKRPKPKARP